MVTGYRSRKWVEEVIRGCESALGVCLQSSVSEFDV
jgi:hypothetical protein